MLHFLVEWLPILISLCLCHFDYEIFMGLLMDFYVKVVVKSQILAGGRGLGTFKNGLKGGVHIVKADQVEDLAGTHEFPEFFVGFKF